MSDELNDDQSHYEISLTAGQAFLAFVLLLLSLAASFAFGLMIGKGQNDERLIVRKEPAVITEASVLPGKKKDDGRIVELGVNADDFKQTTTATSTAPVTDSIAPPAITEGVGQTPSPVPATTTGEAPVVHKAPAPVPAATTGEAPVVHKVPAGTPVYAQLLSSGDQKTAEALAAKVIGAGFTGAYVDRGSNEKGPVFRVRVKFASEADARAAEAKLREYAKDVWIVK